MWRARRRSTAERGRKSRYAVASWVIARALDSSSWKTPPAVESLVGNRLVLHTHSRRTRNTCPAGAVEELWEGACNVLKVAAGQGTRFHVIVWRYQSHHRWTLSLPPPFTAGLPGAFLFSSLHPTGRKNQYDTEERLHGPRPMGEGLSPDLQMSKDGQGDAANRELPRGDFSCHRRVTEEPTLPQWVTSQDSR